MLDCVKPSSSRKPEIQLSIPSKQANSAEGTPQLSPTIDVTDEYHRYLKSNSFGEIRSKIHTLDISSEHQETIQVEEVNNDIDTQMLYPSQESVKQALEKAKPGTPTRLFTAYFEHSEATSLLCLSLLNSVRHARSLYTKLQNLLSVLPLDSDSDTLTHAQCDKAFNVFIEFSTLENPFPCHESPNFHSMRDSFSHLHQQFNQGLSKTKTKTKYKGRTIVCAGFCLIGATVGVTVAAVVIASHALVAIVAAAPLFPACLLAGNTNDDVANLALDAAARGTYFLHCDLNTIDCLVERLYNAVEDDKHLIQLGLSGGCDRHPIHLVAKQLYKNHSNFQSQLVDLEEHVCLCIAAIKRTRSKLLEEIHHQSDTS